MAYHYEVVIGHNTWARSRLLDLSDVRVERFVKQIDDCIATGIASSEYKTNHRS